MYKPTWSSFNTSHNSKTKAISWNDQYFGQCWFYSLKRQFFSSLLYVFEDNEAVIKMIIKGRSPTMRHVSRTHRVALDWLFDRINLDPKIQIKYIDTKKPTRRHFDQGKFHTWWMESSFVFVWTLAISVLPIVLKWCRKERKKMQVKKESQQNRIRWWIWSRDAAKGILTCLPLLHHKARGKPDMKVKYLWARGLSSIEERGRPVKDASSSSYSEWNVDEKWSSQEWKSDEVMEVRTGRLVNEQPPGLCAEHTDRFIVDDDNMDSNTIAESDMSLKSRSFLHSVNDRVRKMLDQSSKDATQDSNTNSLIWECLCLQHWKHLFSCERNTQKFYTPKIQGTISQWNRCLTYLKSW